MRMFVAAVPPEEVLADLDEFWQVRRDAAGFRSSAPESWHLTLAFLAEVRERQLDGLLERLEQAVAKRSRFDLVIAGGGAFPDPLRAKVLYAGVAGDTDELGRLVTGARLAASTAGVAVDGARFHPHLTLARFGRPAQVARWIQVLDTYRGPPWTVEEVALVESHLGEGPRGRPRHETVARFPLTEAHLG
ncbi:2'-5' RNA ligase [metagenome]|uniref:2'-5' RNA ligase n=1 Tax=metagenome TaxID=256318 RepID=A0A2P2C0T1_9ZZZZ